MSDRSETWLRELADLPALAQEPARERALHALAREQFLATGLQPRAAGIVRGRRWLHLAESGALALIMALYLGWTASTLGALRVEAERTAQTLRR